MRATSPCGAAALLVAGGAAFAVVQLTGDDGGTTGASTSSDQAQSRTDKKRGDNQRRADQRRPLPGDRRRAERDDGAGPRGAGGRRGERGRLHARNDRQRGTRSTRPTRRCSIGPARPARPGPSPTGSASTRPARSIRSTRRSPARSTWSCLSAPIGNKGRSICSRSTGSWRDGRSVSRLVRPAAVPVLVFAALVVATFAAFFVTTRLKRAAPVVEQVTFRRSFSPNGDGRFDVALFSFRLRRSDDVTVSVVTRDGDEVLTLAEDVPLVRGRRHRFRWDGHNAAGRVAPDGEYSPAGRAAPPGPHRHLVAQALPRHGAAQARRQVRVAGLDLARRRRRGNSATARFAGPTRRARLLVFRTDLPRPRIVARRDIPRGESTARWDGRVTGGGPAPTGAYLLVVRAQDAAGNVGPRRVPPAPRRSARSPGPGRQLRVRARPGHRGRRRRRAVHGVGGRPAVSLERAPAGRRPASRPRHRSMPGR